MRLTIFFLLSSLVLLLLFRHVNSEGCLLEEQQDELCSETEYEAYITCLQHQKRAKRSSSCNTEPCKECNCEYCLSNTCSNMCNNCCDIYEEDCETAYCCYKRCHSQCRSGECRKDCRKSCNHNIREKKLQKEEEHHILPNITTVINLQNHINNTNILDMPVNINTTNINEINLDKALEMQNDQPMTIDGEKENTIEPETDKTETTEKPEEDNSNCCKIISPRQCVPQTEFPFMKCFHYRHKACGDICQASIMHTQTHQICDENPSGGPPECHNQIIYIPQPQPRCSYLDTWPYVTCNIQNMAATYNVGPYNQPYGQYGYQPYGGSNYGSYNSQPNPLFGMENYYSVMKDVDENSILNGESATRKEIFDFVTGNDIAETIPIEMDHNESKR